MAPLSPSPSRSGSHPGHQAPAPQHLHILKSEARLRTWDRRKPARGTPGAHARTHTRVPGSARGCTRQTYRATQKPRLLRAHRSATAAGRRQPRLVGGPRRGPPSPPGRSPLLQRPPEPARRPGNAARPRLNPQGLSAPTSWSTARLCSTPPVTPPRSEGGLTSAAGAIQQRRPLVPARLGQLCRREERNSGGERREGRGCPGRGAVGLGWLWLGTAPTGLCSAGLVRTSCLDEGVARSAGAAAPARNLNT